MRTYNCPRLYVKDMEIDFLATLEQNFRSALAPPPPPPWQISGYAPEKLWIIIIRILIKSIKSKQL